jgi:hypothetical protein
MLPPPPNNVSDVQYAYIYNIRAITVKLGEDIPFDTNGIMTDGLVHNYGSSVVIIKKRGIYKITYNVYSDSSNNQLQLIVNNHPVWGSLYGAALGYQNSGQTIVNLNEGDVLALRNISGADITLPLLQQDDYSIINASIILDMLK